MNQVTRDIMKLLDVDAETALKVQAIMEQDGFDFSECTTKEFVKEVRYAAFVLKGKQQ